MPRKPVPIVSPPPAATASGAPETAAKVVAGSPKTPSRMRPASSPRDQGATRLVRGHAHQRSGTGGLAGFQVGADAARVAERPPDELGRAVQERRGRRGVHDRGVDRGERERAQMVGGDRLAPIGVGQAPLAVEYLQDAQLACELDADVGVALADLAGVLLGVGPDPLVGLVVGAVRDPQPLLGVRAPEHDVRGEGDVVEGDLDRVRRDRALEALSAQGSDRSTSAWRGTSFHSVRIVPA